MDLPSQRPSTDVTAWYRRHRRVAAPAVLAAALVLLGVAGGIGVSLWRSAEELAAASSASPGASNPESAVPSRSPTLDPSAQATAIPSGGATQAAPGYYPLFPNVWAEVKVDDLRVREGPGTDHPIIRALADGDLVMSIDSLGAGQWVQILADGVAGYVNVGTPDDPWVQAIPTPFSWRTLTGVASNESSYLAYGTWAELDYPPYEGGFERPLLLYSDDGVAWDEQRDGPPGSIRTVAAGPGGWVAISHQYYAGSFASFSSDGQTWHQPAHLDGMAHTVAYGPAGWVALGSGYDEGTKAWQSSDGRAWNTDPVDVPGEGSQPMLEASGAGYVAFDRYAGSLVGSIDGRTWRTTGPPRGVAGWIADVELIGEQVVAIVVDGTTGASPLHRGRLSGDGSIAWEGEIDGTAFAGMRVDSIAQAPDGLLALGWDPEALVPAAWSSPDGSAWTSLGISPDAFGGMVGPELAWGSAGWVGLGTDAGHDTVWRSADGADWELAGGPAAPQEQPPDCSRVPSASVLGLGYLGADAVDCFGGESLTVRGWVPDLVGFDGCCLSDSEPEWLNGPFPTTWLTSGEVDDRRTLPLYVPPGVEASSLTLHRWVEVTGHFHDAAAEQCRSIPTASFPHRLESQASVREACRTRFVVDRITEVPGP